MSEIELTVTTEEKIDLYDELRERLADLQRAFDAEHAELISAISSLRAEIESDVMDAGTTVRGKKLMAVWSRGRRTWDGKKLWVLSEDYPEILVASRVGEPTVSFRAIKDEEEV